MNWHRQHHISGIAAMLLFVMFGISGVVLNHRRAVSHLEISRSFLPPWYTYRNWNGGLLRGTVPAGSGLIVYGANGAWALDTISSEHFRDFNTGFPIGADNRAIRRIVACRSTLFAATHSGVYALRDGQWHRIGPILMPGERLSDLECRGDTIVAVGRSHLYLSAFPGDSLRRVSIPAPPGYQPRVSLFRSMWMLHSGRLFGEPGTIVADALAAIMTFLSAGGLVHLLMRRRVQANRGHGSRTTVRFLRRNLKGHLWVGSTTIVLTMTITLSGWCLRPPIMIPLVLTETAPLPLSSLDSPNPWHDRLRMLRYDAACGDWILSTSDGFFSIQLDSAEPRTLAGAPPVSVMGLNVFERDTDGTWLCGSFRGMFRWNRADSTSVDYFTGTPAMDSDNRPLGSFAVAGYSPQLHAVAEHYSGTDALRQPESMAHLPMALWNVALEAHSGRLFIGQAATFLFILLAGAIGLWCLWSGYKARPDKRTHIN